MPVRTCADGCTLCRQPARGQCLDTSGRVGELATITIRTHYPEDLNRSPMSWLERRSLAERLTSRYSRASILVTGNRAAAARRGNYVGLADRGIVGVRATLYRRVRPGGRPSIWALVPKTIAHGRTNS